jgi:hypothetical protein
MPGADSGQSHIYSRMIMSFIMRIGGATVECGKKRLVHAS